MGTGEVVLEAESNGCWPVERRICDQHFRDPELATALRDNLTEEACDFCDRTETPGRPFAVQIDAIVVGIRALYEAASESGIDYIDTELTSKYTDYDVVYDVVDSEEELLNGLAHNLICDDWVQSNWQRPRPDQEYMQHFTGNPAYQNSSYCPVSPPVGMYGRTTFDSATASTLTYHSRLTSSAEPSAEHQFC